MTQHAAEISIIKHFKDLYFMLEHTDREGKKQTKPSSLSEDWSINVSTSTIL